MKIRNAPAEPGHSAENAFIAVDNLENRLGSCRVEMTVQQELTPDRPCDVRIFTEGDERAMMQLLGTALTRGMMLAKQSGLNARIYAECAPNDKRRMEILRSVGLLDDDAMVRMSRKVVSGPNVVRLPEGCILLSDTLEDGQERAFFLDRQKQLFGRQNAEQWLHHVEQMPMMKRLLLISREGLVGELLCWAEKEEGVIGTVYTSPAWRRKGVATHLMEAARQYFYQCRVMESHVDVRRCMQAMMNLAATAGYRQEKVLCRLPGIDLDAPKKTR